MRKAAVWAAIIVTLGFLLRIVSLSQYPIGFTPDEASFGYDAYSILKTGKDQWGKPFPLVFESFGDYKSPLYTYLTIPSVALFGLNKFAVRLPNALLGSAAIFVVYLLSKKLFKNEKIALFSSLMLAISPWHIMLSRGAFEANLTTFFLPFGLYLFLDKKYILSAVVLGLNLFTYHSAKVVTPLVVLVVLAFNWDELKIEIKKLNFSLGAAFVIFLSSVVLTIYTLFMGAGVRAAERSITLGAVEDAFLLRNNWSLGSLFHNKYLVILKRFFDNFVTYLSPQFLFSRGPNEGTYGMIPGRGVLFWFTVPFFLFLRKIFYQDKKEVRNLIFLFSWVLISIIPASLATGAGYSANRVAVMMPAIEILLGVGAYYFFETVKRRKMYVAISAIVVIVFLSFFMEDYFIQSRYKIAKDMLYGNLEVAEWVSSNVDADTKIIVDRSLSEPHIYFAFAQKYDPNKYQKESMDWNYKERGVKWVDQMGEYVLQDGRFEFKNIHKEYLLEDKIFIGRPSDFPEDVVPTLVFTYPNGEPAIYVLDK